MIRKTIPVNKRDHTLLKNYCNKRNISFNKLINNRIELLLTNKIKLIVIDSYNVNPTKNINFMLDEKKEKKLKKIMKSKNYKYSQIIRRLILPCVLKNTQEM